MKHPHPNLAVHVSPITLPRKTPPPAFVYPQKWGVTAEALAPAVGATTRSVGAANQALSFSQDTQSQPLNRLLTTLFTSAVLLTIATSCARVTVDPIEVKPIHITMDITLRVDRSLDDFFSSVENKAPAPAATTQPIVTP